VEGVNHLEDVVGEGGVGGADAVDREEDVADSGDDVGGGGELRGGEEEEEEVVVRFSTSVACCRA